MLTLNLSLEQSVYAYNGFFLLAFLVAFAVWLNEGRRMRFPWLVWLSTLALVNVLLLAGARLGAYNAQDWAQWFRTGAMPFYGAKAAWGGGLLALVGFGLLMWFWKLPAKTADALLLGFPLVAAVSRLGCFAVGCCFGTPTDGSWGVCYGPETRAYDYALASGTVDEHALSSIPLHPVQLYTALGALAVFGLLLLVRNKLKQPGSVALLAFALLSLNRFWVEFFREAVTDRGISGNEWGGMKAIQWVCLVLAGAMFYWLYRNENKPVNEEESKVNPNTPSVGPLLFGIAFVAWFSRHWLSEAEAWVAVVSIIPPVVLYLIRMFRTTKRNWLPLAWCSATGLLLWNVPPDSLPVLVPKPPFAKTEFEKPTRWLEVGLGANAGQYKEVVTHCDGTKDEYTIPNKSLGGEVAYHYAGFDNSTDLGIGLHSTVGYIDRSHAEPPLLGNHYGYRIVGPFASVDWRGFGFRMGYNVISTPKPDAFRISSKSFTNFYMRIGNYSRFHYDLAFLDNQGFHYFPAPLISTGINWGFDDESGQTNVRLGLSAYSFTNAVIGGRFPLWNHRMSAELTAVLGTEPYIMLGVRGRIPFYR